MSAAQRKKPGRRHAAPTDARVPLSLRVSTEVKSNLDAAAARSGRSRSQEAELALEASLGDRRRLMDLLNFVYGKEAAAVMLLIGQLAIDLQSSSGAAPDRSLSDPWLFGELCKAGTVALKLIDPPDEMKIAPAPGSTAAAQWPEFERDLIENHGLNAANAVHRAIFEKKRAGEGEDAIRAHLPWVASGAAS
jgi:hypothetical protein